MTEEGRGGRSRKPDLGLVDALAQVSFAVQEALGRVAGRNDLSIVQMRLLGILRDREPAMLELAAFLNLDKSSVTGLVSRAEARGLVERRPIPGDRRAVHVVMTVKGRELVQKAAKQVERELETLVEDLGKADKKALIAIASQIAAGETARRLQR